MTQEAEYEIPSVERLPTVSPKGWCRMGLMIQAPKDDRSAGEKARDTAGIVGSRTRTFLIGVTIYQPDVEPSAQGRCRFQ